MMDSYGYLHLALVHETPSDLKFQGFQEINWKKLSTQTYQYFLSSALILTILSITQSAQAQILSVGSRGSDVQAVQSALRSQGYFNANTTGYYGTITRDAVIRFQRANGLSADGVVGPNTLAAIFNPPPQPITPVSRELIGLGRGDRGPGVEDLQERLQQFGYFNTNPTGSFGPITEDAVRRFQQANFIAVTGLVTEDTLALLNRGVVVSNPSTTPPPVLPPTSVLQQGDFGTAVGTVQRQLKQLNFYDGLITNYFDSRTEEAVISFQQTYGIQTTGQVGQTTQSYLASLSTTTPSLPTNQVIEFGNRGIAVSLVQQQLRTLGYYNGPVNGIFDLTTRRAVLNFQRDYGITQTGKVGPTTQAYLIQSNPQVQPVIVSQTRPVVIPQTQPVIIAQNRPVVVPQNRPVVVPQTQPVITQNRPVVVPQTQPVITQTQPVVVQPFRPVQPVINLRTFLRVGDTGAQVREVQRRLRELNYYRGPINGFYDRTTEEAVIGFQRSNSITQTGIVGPTTRMYMFNAQSSAAPQTPSASTQIIPPTQLTRSRSTPPTTATFQPTEISTASVQQLQERLKNQGLYNGPVDGVYNPQTEQAVTRAQELYGSSTNQVLFGGLQLK